MSISDITCALSVSQRRRNSNECEYLVNSPSSIHHSNNSAYASCGHTQDHGLADFIYESEI
jgi:hypothetical protein